MADLTPIPATKHQRVLAAVIRLEVIFAVAALILLAVVFTRPVLGMISAIHVFFMTSDM